MLSRVRALPWHLSVSFPGPLKLLVLSALGDVLWAMPRKLAWSALGKLHLSDLEVAGYGGLCGPWGGVGVL